MFVHMFALYVGGGGHSRVSDLSRQTMQAKNPSCKDHYNEPHGKIIIVARNVAPSDKKWLCPSKEALCKQ